MDKNDILDYVMNTPGNTNRAVLNNMLDSIIDAVAPSGTVQYTTNGEKDVTKYAIAKIDVPTYDLTKSIIYEYGDYPRIDNPGLVRDNITSIKSESPYVSLGQTVFASLSNLKFVSLPKVDNSGAIGQNAFAGCSSLEEVDISRYEGNSSNTGQFAGCSALKTVISPQLRYVSESMFESCTSLTNINLDKVEYIYTKSFKNCTSLEKVIIPKARTIYESAFYGDTAIKYIYVGNSLTGSIADDAFAGVGVNGGVVIDCGFAEGQVSGAPWGATNATINYNISTPTK